MFPGQMAMCWYYVHRGRSRCDKGLTFFSSNLVGLGLGVKCSLEIMLTKVWFARVICFFDVFFSLDVRCTGRGNICIFSLCVERKSFGSSGVWVRKTKVTAQINQTNGGRGGGKDINQGMQVYDSPLCYQKTI